MSGREWKPGDLALVSSWRGTDLIGIRVLPRSDEDYVTWCVFECGDTRGLSDPEVIAARPLVVIDPEDREQVERLLNLLTESHHYYGTGAMLADALREYANPTPPKPEEPTGLGAVVEDASGQLWVRTHHHWRREDLAGIAWDDLSVVRVLSEGVTS